MATSRDDSEEPRASAVSVDSHVTGGRSVDVFGADWQSDQTFAQSDGTHRRQSQQSTVSRSHHFQSQHSNLSGSHRRESQQSKSSGRHHRDSQQGDVHRAHQSRRAVRNSIPMWLADVEADDLQASAGLATQPSRLRTTMHLTGISFIDVARQYARALVRHSWFDALVGAIIVTNSVCIAKEQEYILEEVDTPTLQALEHAFVCFYILELLLRLTGGGRVVLQDRWVQFDSAIISVSVLTLWVVPADKVGGMRALVLVRLARLARLARCVRLIIVFRELWLLVNGLLSSAGVLFWSLVLILLLIYFFALVGMEVIAIRHATTESANPEVDSIVAEYFSSVGITMLTLTQFVTLDSIAAVYTPLVRNDPLLAIYFVAVILAIAIVLMNIITAVLVNESLEQAQQNKEAANVHKVKQKKKVLKDLHEFFLKLDDDNSGKVDLEEILSSTEDDMEAVRGLVRELDLREVFEALDIDRDGALDVEEFCEGLYQFGVLQRPLDFKRIDKRLDSVRTQMQEMHSTQAGLAAKIHQLDQRLDVMLPNLACTSKTGAIDNAVKNSSKDALRSGGDILCELRKMQPKITCQLAAALGQHNGDAATDNTRQKDLKAGLRLGEEILSELRKLQVEISCQVAAALDHQPLPTSPKERISQRKNAAHSADYVESDSKVAFDEGIVPLEFDRNVIYAFPAAPSMSKIRGISEVDCDHGPPVPHESNRNAVYGFPTSLPASNGQVEDLALLDSMPLRHPMHPASVEVRTALPVLV